MKQTSFNFPIPDDCKVIFRPWITLKNGQKLYAWQVGKKAFPILVRKDK